MPNIATCALATRMDIAVLGFAALSTNLQNAPTRCVMHCLTLPGLRTSAPAQGPALQGGNASAQPPACEFDTAAVDARIGQFPHAGRLPAEEAAQK